MSERTRHIVKVDVTKKWYPEGRSIDPRELSWATRLVAWLFYSRDGEWRVQDGEPRFGLWEAQKHLRRMETYREPELMIDEEVGIGMFADAQAYERSRADFEKRDIPTDPWACDACGLSLRGFWQSGGATCYDRRDGWIGHRHTRRNCVEKSDKEARDRFEYEMRLRIMDLRPRVIHPERFLEQLVEYYDRTGHRTTQVWHIREMIAGIRDLPDGFEEPRRMFTNPNRPPAAPVREPGRGMPHKA